jgi:hypothetical protein
MEKVFYSDHYYVDILYNIEEGMSKNQYGHD